MESELTIQSGPSIFYKKAIIFILLITFKYSFFSRSTDVFLKHRKIRDEFDVKHKTYWDVKLN